MYMYVPVYVRLCVCVCVSKLVARLPGRAGTVGNHTKSGVEISTGLLEATGYG